MLREYLVGNGKKLVIYMKEEFTNGMGSTPVGVAVLR